MRVKPRGDKAYRGQLDLLTRKWWADALKAQGRRSHTEARVMRTYANQVRDVLDLPLFGSGDVPGQWR